MVTIPTKRKRAKKACIPCHQRKRKCDGHFPCSMCSDYDYNCRYESVAVIDNVEILPVVEPSNFLSENHVPSLTMNISQHLGNSSCGDSSTGKADTLINTTPAGTSSEHNVKDDDASAVMAFPRTLGMVLGSEEPPKRHWYGYNFGSHHEETFDHRNSLAELVSEHDVKFLSNVYFSAMAPPFANLMDPKVYFRRYKDYQQDFGGAEKCYGAIVAGVVALGSFLSGTKHSQESELVRYAKAVLDDSRLMHTITPDHIIAWALRALYLRASGNPITSWIASCTTMHFIEVLGLQRQEYVVKLASTDDGAALGYDEGRLRKIFWTLWAGHNILSYECGRQPVQYQSVTTQAVDLASDLVTSQFVAIAQTIPVSNSTSHPTNLATCLKALHELPAEHLFLVITKADLAFCFYRRIFELQQGISQEVVRLVTEIGDAAVEAAEMLASQGCVLWNIIGSVFQYICVLLAIDAYGVSIHMNVAFSGLENVVGAIDTVSSREALSMARYLLNLYTSKKRKELAQLEAIGVNQPTLQAESEFDFNTFVPSRNGELDWGQFLFEPYLSMLFPGS